MGHVLMHLNADGAFSLDRSGLLEQPLLEFLDFFKVLRALRVHDEERACGRHSPGKEPNQPAGFQFRLDERCARQDDAKPANGRRKEQDFVTVSRSLTGVAIAQADCLEPDRP
jgi:hypothetical protein